MSLKLTDFSCVAARNNSEARFWFRLVQYSTLPYIVSDARSGKLAIKLR